MGAITERIKENRKKVQAIEHRLSTLLNRYGIDAEEKEKKDENFFPLRAKTLKELRVAAVMDRFTLDSYRPECTLLELVPAEWKEQIDGFRPDLVFIESAWEGKDKLWYRFIANGSETYYEMISYCHEQGIPVVFWNKEDPVYTDVFMPAARMADFVFTTDIDCVARYKAELGHDRVYCLHFAAQPALHNPIEKYDRKDMFCFAGAYYHRYTERIRVFDAFAKVFMDGKGFEIYDRNYGNARPEHAFPAYYEPCILGKLDPSEIDRAYKGYYYGVNMNSVQQSQTMFARRAFEMLASNTVTVGNYARGVKNFFGDLTICTDDEKHLENCLNNYCGDEEARDKYRLLGLRKVLREHLYEDRLGYIVSKVFGKDMRTKLPLITVVAKAESNVEADRVLSMFRVQTYDNKKLALYTALDTLQVEDERVAIYPISDAERTNIGAITKEGYVAVFSAQDWYGENYLLDMALTMRYGTYDALGKKERFVSKDGTLERINIGEAYKAVDELPVEASMALLDKVAEVTAASLFAGEQWRLSSMMSIDRYNYASGWTEKECPGAEDMCIPDQGLSMAEIEHVSEAIQAEEHSGQLVKIKAEEIAAIPLPKGGELSWRSSQQGARLCSTLAEGQHQYIYMRDSIEIAPYMQDGKLAVCFEGRGNLDIICVCIFYDDNGNKLAALYPKLNRKEYLQPPVGAVSVKLGLRPKGTGECNLRQITLGADIITEDNSCFLSRSNVLVLSNHYPAPEALYRNMFVHQRVRAYRDAGKLVDVMRMNIYAKDGYREFEGINVVEGRADTLAAILQSGRIDTVCVHFLDTEMWSVLREYAKDIRIIVWLHGAEIQPWWRREYNYSTEEELEKAKKVSAERQKFWDGVFDELEQYNLQFVFVSQYFADEVSEDYKISLPEERYYIIHNCIDTDYFSYEKKDLEQRKKILSIRPYASRKYANDLSVKCIQELSKQPFFLELEFRMIGSGDQFESTLKPLRKFKNVSLEEGFLRQEEIAALHKEYGIFLVPTRMDAQGVSRDEAMSSGLVPITNSVAAIPEFVDNSCGVLAPAEDYKAMADGIERLYNNPTLFEEMSEAAACRVRNQTDSAHTIGKELNLIFGSEA